MAKVRTQFTSWSVLICSWSLKCRPTTGVDLVLGGGPNGRIVVVDSLRARAFFFLSALSLFADSSCCFGSAGPASCPLAASNAARPRKRRKPARCCGEGSKRDRTFQEKG
jgi:hypothetical protein